MEECRMLAQGAVLAGRYRIEKLLGEGGSARTFGAFDLVTGTPVALKLLHDAPAAAGFRAEFARLRELSHPHLVRVRDYGRAAVEGRLVPFFTSDLVVGGTLRAHCARVGLKSAEQALYDALSALSFLHRLGLRHGDLKPENVLVDEHGRGVLIDLGCAVAVSAHELRGGTPAYLAPELARGEPADQRADLYALGVMLLELGAEGRLRALAERLSQQDVRKRPGSLASACAESGLDLQLDSRPLGRATPMLGRGPALSRACEALTQVVRGAEGPRLVWVEAVRGMGATRFLRELGFAVDAAFSLYEAQAERESVRALFGRAFNTSALGLEALVQCVASVAARRHPTLLLFHDLERAPPERATELMLALGATPERGALAWVVASTRPPPPSLRAACLHLVLTPLSESELSGWAGELVPESRIPALRAYTGGFPLHVERALAALAAGQLQVDALAAPSATGIVPDAPLAALLADLDANERALLASVALELRPAVEARGPAREQRVEARGPAREQGVEARGPARLLERGLVCEEAGFLRLARESDAAPILSVLPAALVKQWSLRAAEACERDGSAESVALRIGHLARAGREQAALVLLHEQLALARRHPRSFARSAELLVDEMSASERVLLAGLLRESGEPRRGLALCARARRLLRATVPDELYVEAAECCLALGNLKRATRLLARVRAASAHVTLECSVRLRIRQGDYAAARALAEAALAAQPEPTLRARLHEGLALACSYLGEHETARAQLSQAEAAESDPTPRTEARHSALHGFLAMRRADPEQALVAYQRALGIADRLGLSDLVANALLNMASARHLLGSYGNARELYERALRMARALGRRQSELLLRANLANVALECGAFEEAATLLDALEAEKATPVVHALRRWRAELLLVTGQPEQALQLLEQLAPAAEGTRDAQEGLLLMAEAQLALGAPLRAQECLADKALVQLAEPDLEAKRELLCGRVALESGRDELALVHFERALSVARGAALSPLAARIESQLGELYARAGLPALEREHRRRAQAGWERMALDLPRALRDAFWRHPERARAAPDPERAAASRGSLSFARVVELSRRINAQRTIDEVLSFALDAAIELACAERGFVLLYDQSAQSFEVKCARGVDEHPLAAAPFEWSRSIAERVLTSGEAVITLDAAHDARFQSQASVHAMGLKSVLCVPIIGARGLKGALYLDNRYLRSRFTEPDAELVQALAEQVAVALGNAQLFQELGQKQRELLRKQRKVEELLSGKEREVEQLSLALAEERAARATRYTYRDIVGTSASLRRLFATLDRVIPTDLPVIVLGESGTGKELVARAIHDEGPRKQRAFVGINCGALPAALLESELFGHVRGAFTGADRDKTGLFVAAHGGTLFLDELGELPLALQVKLLRALTERSVRPLGATRSVDVDVRLLAATNRDLRGMVAQGSFREDLFYRLSVVEITLSPLRERKEDILPIAENLLRKRAQALGTQARKLSSAAAQRLLGYSFPGNVRELENILLRADALCETESIRAADLGLATRAAPASKHAPQSRSDFARQESELLLEALERERWNVSRVSRSLGIPRNTLYRKLARLGLAAESERRATGGLGREGKR